MSIPRRPFYFAPDEFEDFGYLGEHQLHFRAWLEADDNDRIRVIIFQVWIELVQDSGTKLEVDVTKIARSDRERLFKYEGAIRADYLSKREKEWESAV
jgi:hypothetical protein